MVRQCDLLRRASFLRRHVLPEALGSGTAAEGIRRAARPANKAMKLSVLRFHGPCVRTSRATSARSLLPSS